MALQRPPLDVAEQQPPRVRLQPDEARVLRRRRQPAPRRLRIAGEVELVHHLAVQRHREVGPIDGDLVVVPLADRVRRGRQRRAP